MERVESGAPGDSNSMIGRAGFIVPKHQGKLNPLVFGFCFLAVVSGREREGAY